MISLFLDSSTSYMIVGIYRDLEQLYLKIEPNDNHLSERLLPAIRTAFDKISMSINEIEKIYVVNGPGSFTGVRIGVTVAKVLAWTLKKPIISVSELELLATTCSNQKCATLIDARRDCVYAGIYDGELNVIMKDQYISLEDLWNQKEEDTVLVSADKFSFDTILPDFHIEKLLLKHQNDMPTEPHELKPNYLKRTEAEEKMVYSVSELEIPKIQELIVTVFGNPVENDPFVSYLKYVDSENEIQGILSYSIIYERMEINYIYVEKNVRRKGIAQSLIDFLIKIACEKNIQNISLEVSKDNEAAILLYQKMGFQDKAIRPNYYQGIDGILMVKEMIK